MNCRQCLKVRGGRAVELVHPGCGHVPAAILINVSALFLVLLLLGCRSATPLSVPTGAPAVTELNMLAVPVALNLDGLPGPDTVAVKIYAGNLRESKPVPITSGKVELFMFDGLLRKSTNAPTPLHTWSFTAKQLKRYEYRASIGTGYELTASWTTNKPRASKATLISRYTPDSGSPIYSAPGTISVTGN